MDAVTPVVPVKRAQESGARNLLRFLACGSVDDG